MSALYKLGRYTVGPVVRGLWRPWTDGLSHLPAEGPAVLASNHLSVADSIFLPLVAPREIAFLAKAEYFTGDGLRGRATAAFMRGIRQIPVERGNGRAALSALDIALTVLREGNLFGIYPEGTRSPDGKLHRGHTGIARIVLEARVPVIPVAMINTDKVQPIGARLPRLGHAIGIRMGAPLDYSAHADGPRNPKLLREITDDIMAHIRRLSGQDYVDRYASRDKSVGPAADPNG
ncbi:lysophospholipid acyltransferase family protein [Rugosimonospora acidiphila]|uniref:Lysophospholipid acyltransferase family protein n=1 Tax=Rugosimonospora acidiphila TaxID=556531 RepID=A0ABP9RSY0_9ACTN